jgi:hypothetical protein
LPPHSDPLLEYPLLISHIFRILLFNVANGKVILISFHGKCPKMIIAKTLHKNAKQEIF